MATLSELENEVLRLPKDQRVSLIHRILEKSELPENSDVKNLWNAEILDRIERLDANSTERHSASDVFQAIDEQFAQ
ncbi:hypothetical protein Rhal01_01366 [Rubritalea halochordaticola]|uniref:Addiction module protein n=1 Tax=Rubritalea halochordaticola TaxID=714537 RepID=A0ABP9UXK5_9BACT